MKNDLYMQHRIDLDSKNDTDEQGRAFWGCFQTPPIWGCSPNTPKFGGVLGRHDGHPPRGGRLLHPPLPLLFLVLPLLPPPHLPLFFAVPLSLPPSSPLSIGADVPLLLLLTTPPTLRSPSRSILRGDVLARNKLDDFTREMGRCRSVTTCVEKSREGREDEGSRGRPVRGRGPGTMLRAKVWIWGCSVPPRPLKYNFITANGVDPVRAPPKIALTCRDACL